MIFFAQLWKATVYKTSIIRPVFEKNSHRRLKIFIHCASNCTYCLSHYYQSVLQYTEILLGKKRLYFYFKDPFYRSKLNNLKKFKTNFSTSFWILITKNHNAKVAFMHKIVRKVYNGVQNDKTH